MLNYIWFGMMAIGVIAVKTMEKMKRFSVLAENHD